MHSKIWTSIVTGLAFAEKSLFICSQYLWYGTFWFSSVQTFELNLWSSTRKDEYINHSLGTTNSKHSTPAELFYPIQRYPSHCDPLGHLCSNHLWTTSFKIADLGKTPIRQIQTSLWFQFLQTNTESESLNVEHPFKWKVGGIMNINKKNEKIRPEGTRAIFLLYSSLILSFF